MRSTTFQINDASTGCNIPAVWVTIAENDNGTLSFSLAERGSRIGDLRGFFFDLADERLIGSLAVTHTSAGFTEFKQGNDSVVDLGDGANMQGLTGSTAAQPRVAGAEGNGYDAGIEIGTAGIGRDDLQSFSFTLGSSVRALTLDDFANVDIGVRLTSVGLIGGSREGSDKMLEHIGGAIDARDDTNTVTEDSAPNPVSGNVFANDLHLDPVHFVAAVNGSPFILCTEVVGTYGTLRIDALGRYSYDLDNTKAAVQALGAGEQAVDNFTYLAKSIGEFTSSSSDSATLRITIVGHNDAAVLSSASVDLDETDAPLTTGGVLTISDIDGPEAFAAQTGTAGANGIFTINAAGAWTYAADSAFNELNPGDTLVDVFDVFSADHTRTSVTVRIHGTSDSPFTEGNDLVDFNTLAPGVFNPTAFYDALSGNDIVFLPDAARAAVLGYDASNTFLGGAGDDQIEGRDLNDRVDGGAGNDSLRGNGGDDTINGGGGFDTLVGGDGDDVLDGGADGQADSLSGGAGNDRLIVHDNGEFAAGDAGDDRIEIGDDVFDVTLMGGEGIDRVVATAASHEIHLANFDLSYRFGTSSNPLFIAHGVEQFEADVIALTDLDATGGTTPAVLALGNLSTVASDGGTAELRGGARDDTIEGTSQGERINGQGGNDGLYGNGGDDTINGGGGFDTLVGGDGDDVLDGGADGQADSLSGGAGNDRLIVHDNGEFAAGDAGDDRIEIGDDVFDVTLMGGEGIDRVVATAASHEIHLANFDLSYRFGTSSNPLFIAHGVEQFEADVIALTDLDATGGTTPAVLALGNLSTVASDGGTAELRGGARDDTIEGTSQGERINGQGGNDGLYGNGGDDTINGGGGFDTLVGGDGDDVLDGGADGQADSLSGGAGNDRLIVHDNGEFAAGDAGDDRIEIGDDVFDVTLMGGEGIDRVVATAASHEIHLANFDLSYRFGTSSNPLFIAHGVEQFEADVIALTDLDATGGTTPAVLALGNLSTVASDGGTAELRGGARDDTIEGTSQGERINGQGGNDGLYGNGGDDTINGGGGFDTLVGGDGDDVLDGGADGQADSLSGGAGNDRLIVHDNGEFAAGDAGDDRIEIGDDVFDVTLMGGEGIDRVVATAASHEIHLANFDLSYRFGTSSNPLFIAHGVEQFEADVIALTDLDATGGTTPAVLALGNLSTVASDGGTAELRGGARDDTIEGTSQGERINGQGGNDGLYGNGGDDTINGGGGFDTLVGGDGDDVLDGGADGQADSLSGGAGNDRLIVHDNGEFAAGDAGDDRIEIGDDVFDVTLMGGEGIDRVVATAASHEIHLANFDLSYRFGTSSNPLFIAHGVEQFEADVIALTDLDATGGTTPAVLALGNLSTVASDGGTAELRGGARDDTIEGTSQGERINGQGGNDGLYGNGGDDTINGGGGFDTLVGGDGDDVLDGGADGQADSLSGGAGNDRLIVHDNGEFAAGDAGDDRIEIGDDVFDVTLMGGEGIDRVVATAASHEIHLANFDLSYRFGTSSNPLFIAHGVEQFEADVIALTDLDATGGTTPAVLALGNLSTVASDGGTAELRGGARDDTIEGTSQGERINGQGGNDGLYGNGGDDTINGGGGFDTLVGGDGDDVLDGGADGQADSLSGGAGNDRLIVHDNGEFAAGDAGDDRIEIGDDVFDVTLMGGEGIDRVVATAASHEIHLANFDLSYRFGTSSNPLFIAHGVEQFEADVIALTDLDATGGTTPAVLALGNLSTVASDGGTAELRGGARDDTIEGTSQGERINGQGGNDGLYGNGGDDTINGGGGFDTLVGGDGDDRFVYGGNDGQDTITDFSKAGPGVDILDLHDLLKGFAGYDGSNAFADGYLQFLNTDTDTQVIVDSDGTAGAAASTLLVTLTDSLLTQADTANYFL